MQDRPQPSAPVRPIRSSIGYGVDFLAAADRRRGEQRNLLTPHSMALRESQH